MPNNRRTSTSKHIAVVAGLTLSMVIAPVTTLVPSVAYATEQTAAEQTAAEQRLDDVKARAAVDVVTVSDFDSIVAAVEAVPTDGTSITIKLDADIVVPDNITIAEGQSVVLDMNGHKMTPSDSLAGRFVINNGDLVVTGDGTMDSSGNYPNAYGSIDTYGSTLVESGTFVGSVDTMSANLYCRTGATLVVDGGSFSGSCTAISSSGDLAINGGYFESPWYPAIEANGVTVINDGEFVNTSCSSCDKDHWGYTIRNGRNSDEATMTINGGIVKGIQGGIATIGGMLTINDVDATVDRCENDHNAVFYALYVAGESYDTSCVVNGGTFTSTERTAVFVGNSGSDGGDKEHATCEINGGTFTGQDKLHVDDELGGLLLTGGDYNQPLDAAFIKDGSYAMVYDGGEMWTIGTDEELLGSGAQAYVDDADGTRTYYETAEDAKAAVADDPTLTITTVSYDVTVAPVVDGVDTEIATDVPNGTGLVELADALDAKAAEIDAVLEGSGYEFGGWYLDKELTVPLGDNASVLGGDVVLYPKLVQVGGETSDGEQGSTGDENENANQDAGGETGDGAGEGGMNENAVVNENGTGGVGGNDKGDAVDVDDIMQTGVASVASVIGVGAALSGIGALVSKLIGKKK